MGTSVDVTDESWLMISHWDCATQYIGNDKIYNRGIPLEHQYNGMREILNTAHVSMEHHHFQWLNQLNMTMFNSKILVGVTEGINSQDGISSESILDMIR